MCHCALTCAAFHTLAGTPLAGCTNSTLQYCSPAPASGSLCRYAYKAATTVCRAAAGPCDAPESCTGSSAFCPANSFLGTSQVCRPAAGICDQEERCTGAQAGCPPDSLSPSGTVCRAAAGACDVAEVRRTFWPQPQGATACICSIPAVACCVVRRVVPALHLSALRTPCGRRARRAGQWHQAAARWQRGAWAPAPHAQATPCRRLELCAGLQTAPATMR